MTEPKTNPVIEDRVQVDGREPLGTLATTAERRIVLVSGRRNEDGSLTDNFGKFCAEPPPDTAESVSASFQAALAAAAEQPGGVSGQLSAELGRQVATAVQALSQRSQGIVLFRDGSYQLCAALLNKYITPQEFVARWDALLQTTQSLVQVELEKSGGRIGYAPQNLSGPQLNQLKSFLDEYFKNMPQRPQERAEGKGTKATTAPAAG